MAGENIDALPDDASDNFAVRIVADAFHRIEQKRMVGYDKVRAVFHSVLKYSRCDVKADHSAFYIILA